MNNTLILIISFFAVYRRNIFFGGMVVERECVCVCARARVYTRCGKCAYTLHLQQTSGTVWLWLQPAGNIVRNLHLSWENADANEFKMYPRKGWLKNLSFQTEVPRKKPLNITSNEKFCLLFQWKNQDSHFQMAFSFIIQSYLVELGLLWATLGQEAAPKDQETQVSRDPGTFSPAEFWPMSQHWDFSRDFPAWGTSG